VIAAADPGLGRDLAVFYETCAVVTSAVWVAIAVASRVISEDRRVASVLGRMPWFVGGLFAFGIAGILISLWVLKDGESTLFSEMVALLGTGLTLVMALGTVMVRLAVEARLEDHWRGFTTVVYCVLLTALAVVPVFVYVHQTSH
jgi:hypothetical protein